MFTTLPPRFGVWRAALLLAATAFLMPGRAEAGCGDHVTILNESGEPVSYATSPSDDAPQPARPPCQGPNCSGSPHHDPAPSTVAPVGPQAKELVGTVDRPRGENDSPVTFEIDSAACPVPLTSDIFHPPRLG
jgi:hypothetical protein